MNLPGVIIWPSDFFRADFFLFILIYTHDMVIKCGWVRQQPLWFDQMTMTHRHKAVLVCRQPLKQCGHHRNLYQFYFLNYINFLWKYTSKDATHRVVLVCRQPLKHSSMWTSSTSSTWGSFCNNKVGYKKRALIFSRAPQRIIQKSNTHTKKRFVPALLCIFRWPW